MIINKFAWTSTLICFMFETDCFWLKSTSSSATTWNAITNQFALTLICFMFEINHFWSRFASSSLLSWNAIKIFNTTEIEFSIDFVCTFKTRVSRSMQWMNKLSKWSRCFDWSVMINVTFSTRYILFIAWEQNTLIQFRNFKKFKWSWIIRFKMTSLISSSCISFIVLIVTFISREWSRISFCKLIMYIFNCAR